MRSVLLVSMLLACISIFAQQNDRTLYFPKRLERVEKIPNKNNVWVFLMAGQSNMAGRGLVEPRDTVVSKRVLTITSDGLLVYAKEPLHFYEPNMAGLDCGLSFGKTLIKHVPKNIIILLVPTAVGGSSIQQWLGDSTYRKVTLLSNFKEKVQLAKKYGIIKGLLWHQGESDAHKETIPLYENRLSQLFQIFRNTIQNPNLPIVIGELGAYSDNKEDWNAINQAIHHYSLTDTHVKVVSSQDLQNKGDHIHFNSEGQRKLGERYAQAWITINKK